GDGRDRVVVEPLHQLRLGLERGDDVLGLRPQLVRAELLLGVVAHGVPPVLADCSWLTAARDSSGLAVSLAASQTPFKSVFPPTCGGQEVRGDWREPAMSMIIESSVSDPGWWRMETGTEPPQELPAPDGDAAA